MLDMLSGVVIVLALACAAVIILFILIGLSMILFDIVDIDFSLDFIHDMKIVKKIKIKYYERKIRKEDPELDEMLDNLREIYEQSKESRERW